MIIGMSRTDEERGRSFLRALLKDDTNAAAALYEVLDAGVGPRAVNDDLCTILGAMLAEWIKEERDAQD